MKKIKINKQKIYIICKGFKFKNYYEHYISYEYHMHYEQYVYLQPESAPECIVMVLYICLYTFIN